MNLKKTKKKNLLNPNLFEQQKKMSFLIRIINFFKIRISLQSKKLILFMNFKWSNKMKLMFYIKRK